MLQFIKLATLLFASFNRAVFVILCISIYDLTMFYFTWRLIWTTIIHSLSTKDKQGKLILFI